MKKQTFEDWKIKTNWYCYHLSNCCCDDLPDWRYYLDFVENISPKNSARRAIKNAFKIQKGENYV